MVSCLPRNTRDVVQAVAGTGIDGFGRNYLGLGIVSIESYSIGNLVIVRNYSRIFGRNITAIDTGTGYTDLWSLATLNNFTDGPIGVIVLAGNRRGKLIADGFAFCNHYRLINFGITIIEGNGDLFRIIIRKQQFLGHFVGKNLFSLSVFVLSFFRCLSKLLAADRRTRHAHGTLRARAGSADRCRIGAVASFCIGRLFCFSCICFAVSRVILSFGSRFFRIRIQAVKLGNNREVAVDRTDIVGKKLCARAERSTAALKVPTGKCITGCRNGNRAAGDHIPLNNRLEQLFGRIVVERTAGSGHIVDRILSLFLFFLFFLALVLLFLRLGLGFFRLGSFIRRIIGRLLFGLSILLCLLRRVFLGHGCIAALLGLGIGRPSIGGLFRLLRCFGLLIC